MNCSKSEIKATFAANIIVCRAYSDCNAKITVWYFVSVAVCTSRMLSSLPVRSTSIEKFDTLRNSNESGGGGCNGGGGVGDSPAVTNPFVARALAACVSCIKCKFSVTFFGPPRRLLHVT